MHSAYDQFFQHRHSRESVINFDQQEKDKSDFDIQRSPFLQLISAQRILVSQASREPSLWWFNYGFSANRYNELVQQEVDVFRMLHSMNTTVSRRKTIQSSSIYAFFL